VDLAANTTPKDTISNMAQKSQLPQRPSLPANISTDSLGFVHIDLPAKSPETSERTDFNMAETHTFPKDLPDWSNLKVLHRNTLPARASFFLYNTPEDALTRDVSKSKTFSLSGTWKFDVAKSPFDTPENFHEPKYDTSKWGDIEVPGMWQLQGYGKGPKYVFAVSFENVVVLTSEQLPQYQISLSR